MEDNNRIAFKLQHISTEQFAILEENYKKSKETNLKTEVEFGFDDEKQLIGSYMGFVFSQNDKVFLKIKVGCHFGLEKGSWEHLLNQEKTVVTFPKKFMAHLASITIGTTRGVLFAKTENTQFTGFIVPLLNAEEFLTDDVSFTKNDDPK